MDFISMVIYVPSLCNSGKAQDAQVPDSQLDDAATFYQARAYWGGAGNLWPSALAAWNGQ